MRKVLFLRQEMPRGTLHTVREERPASRLLACGEPTYVRVFGFGCVQAFVALAFVCLELFSATKPNAARFKHGVSVAELDFLVFAKDLVEILD